MSTRTRGFAVGVAMAGFAAGVVNAADEAPAPVVDTIPIAAPAAAAAPAADPDAKPHGKGLDEIIVTAQRREESIQKVPISITIFNQQQISNANITNSADLANYTPSLSTNTRFGAENATFAIRGFTQDLRTTASVGTYFAEVVAPRGQTIQSSGDGAGPGTLFDLQNVQVLKGPQGTLFGRNTTGGAVLIVPNKPKDEFEGYVEMQGGQFDLFRQQAVVNVPVAERFKLRLGVDHDKRAGYIDNVPEIGADELANVHYFASRLSAVWNVTDAVENYTILTWVNSKTHGTTSQLFACNPNPTQSPLALLLIGVNQDQLVGNACQEQLDSAKRNGKDGFYDAYSTVATPLTAIKEKRAINTTTWDVTEGVTLKNILAYAHLETENGSSVFGTQFDAAYDLNPAREFTVGVTVPNPDFPVTSQETWVEEIQAQGKWGDAVQWQAGLYYEHSKPDGWSGNNSTALISCNLASLEQQPEDFDCFSPEAGLLAGVLVYRIKQDYLNRAAYTQATWDISDRFSITGGFRYTWDRTKGDAIKERYRYAGAVHLTPEMIEQDPVVHSSAPTGVLEGSYRPFDDVMTYAKYSRGYRQGSINLGADPGIDTYKPEKVDTYEIGAKTTFGGPIPGRFNVAAFYNDFRDMQLQTGYVSFAPTTAIFNAGKARIAGAEVEAFFQLLDDLTASVSYSFLNTKLLEQEDHKADVIAAGGTVAGLTYTPIADVGDELPFAPDHTVVTSLTYTLPLSPEYGNVDLGATWVYTGKRRTAATSATPYDMLAPFELLNLNLTWTGVFGSPVDLAVFGTNVLDEKYVTYSSGTYTAVGFDARMVGTPRMVGARLRYNFGAYAQR